MRAAIVLIIAAACGDHVEPPREVEVIVMELQPDGWWNGAAGRTVVFSEGGVDTEVMTDDAGRAVGTVDALADVTLRNKFNLPGGATIVGVEPGDHLCYGGCEPRPAPGPVSLYVRAPLSVDPYPGQSRALFSHEGIDADDLGTTMCPAPCTAPIDIHAIAVDDQNHTLAWTTLAGQTIADGVAIHLPGPWHPAVAFSGAAVNLGATGSFQLAYRPPPSMQGISVYGNSSLTLTGPVAQLGPTMMMEMDATGASQQMQYVFDVVPMATTYQFDGATDLLPWISNLRRDATGVLAWDESPGHTYGGVLVSYQRSLGDAPYGVSIFAPAGYPITVSGPVDGISVTLVDRSDVDYAGLRQGDLRDRGAPGGLRLKTDTQVTARRSIAIRSPF